MALTGAELKSRHVGLKHWFDIEEDESDKKTGRSVEGCWGVRKKEKKTIVCVFLWNWRAVSRHAMRGVGRKVEGAEMC